MADDKITHVHPDVLKAVEKVMGDHLKGMNLVDLKACQEALQATREALLDMQQNFEVWHKLAQMKGDQAERLSAQVDELQERITDMTVEMSAEIALLRSALENKKADSGVTSEDHE